MVSFDQLPYKIYDNIAIPHFIQPRTEIRTKFKIRPKTDIIVASYQKSGTTWTQNILRHLLWPGDTTLLCERVPWINVIRPLSLSLEEIERLPDPRVIKTHDPVQWIDDLLQGSEAKLIYVYRDPGDVAVSYYNHMSLKPSMGGVTFQHFYRDVIRNPVRANHGLWEDHVGGYLELRNQKQNMLLLRYEDMVEDLAREIGRIAQFIGVECCSDSLIAEVEEKTQFSYMKKDTSCNYSHHYKHDLFMRNGKVGTWKEYLTYEQGQELSDIQRQVFNKYGILI